MLTLKSVEDTLAVAASTLLIKGVLVDVLGNVVTAWLKQHFVRTRRELALWKHTVERHNTPRQQCQDDPCPILQTARVAALPPTWAAGRSWSGNSQHRLAK